MSDFWFYVALSQAAAFVTVAYVLFRCRCEQEEQDYQWRWSFQRLLEENRNLRDELEARNETAD